MVCGGERRITSDSTVPLGGWLAGKVEGSCRDTAGSSRSSLDQGELKGKLELLVCVRCCRQRLTHSRAICQARHAPTFRTPDGSVEDPAPAAWAGVLVFFQGRSELLGGKQLDGLAIPGRGLHDWVMTSLKCA